MKRTCVLVLFALAACSAAGETLESRLRAQIDRLPPADQAFFAKAKFAGEYPLNQLLTYSNRDGRVFTTFHLPPALVDQFDGGTPLLIALEGSGSVWAIHRTKSGTLDEGLSLITLTCYAPGQAWPFNRFSMSSDGHSVMVSAAQVFGHPASQQTISMTQTDRSVRLTWRLEAERFEAKRIEVANLAEISTRAPEVMEQYLLPVLRRLGPARPASDIYRVFNQIPADPKSVRQIEPILAQLDAADPAAREAALESLKKLGRAGLLAALRAETATLSPEQKARLESFFAADGWFHPPDLEAARNDLDFITACMEDQDPAVRNVAVNMAAALRTVRQLKK